MSCTYKLKNAYIEEFYKLGHAPTWNISWQNHLFPKRCTLQGISESHIAEKPIDTVCVTLGIYEHITYHIMKKFSSCGMDQLDIFMPKSSLSKNCIMQSIRDSQIAVKKLKTEHFMPCIYECLVHIMRNLSSWGMLQLEILHEKSSFSKKMYLAKH